MTRRETALLAAGLFVGAALMGVGSALTGDSPDADPVPPLPVVQPDGTNVVAVERGQGKTLTKPVKMGDDWELRWTFRQVPESVQIIRTDAAGEEHTDFVSPTRTPAFRGGDPSADITGRRTFGLGGTVKVWVIAREGAPWKLEFIQHSGRIE